MPALSDTTIGGQSVVAGITARAGGTQALGTALTAAINQISVCATGADSVVLPQAVLGGEVTVINNGAAACQVYGQALTTDTINNVATATGVSVPAGKVARFSVWQGSSYVNGAIATVGKWAMVLSA